MKSQFDRAEARLLSFTVFGTLINVRSGAYGAFETILDRAGATGVNVEDFWEAWEECNVEQYWQPWRPYKDICRDSLALAFERFGIAGDSALIHHYFDAFASFKPYSDVEQAIALLAEQFQLALVSDIDADLLTKTTLARRFNLIVTADQARGYKPDGSLFRCLLAQTGVPARQILHSGQSQFTDIIGARPIGIAVAWVNRRGVALNYKLPQPNFILPDVASVARLMLKKKAEPG